MAAPRHWLTRLPWAGIFCACWLLTLGSVWWLVQQTRGQEARQWHSHLFPLHVASPEKIKAREGVPGKKVGWLVGDARFQAWPELMPQVYVWENLGSRGYTTRQTADWLRANIRASGLPDVIVIQVGINDILGAGYQLPLLEKITAAAKRNLSEFPSMVSEQGGECKIIFTTIVPRGPLSWHQRFLWKPELDDAVKELNLHIRSLAGPNVSVVDSWAALETERFVRDGDSGADLELNASGGGKLAAAVLQVLPQE